MIYLILAIASSMMISVLMRISEKSVCNNISMLATNYLMCSLLALAFGGTLELFPSVEGLPLGIGLGVINGLLYLSGFVLLGWNIARNGVVLSATFMKLGVLVPTVMAITVFGEVPRPNQILGLIAALAAIVLIQGDGRAEKTHNLLGLILLLLSGGGADAMSKVYDEIGPAALKDQFLMYTFATALILCVLFCIVKKQRVTAADLLWGAVIGVPNYLSSRFLLLAVGEIPAVAAYPSYSVGTIILVTLVGVAVFREKLSRRKLIALGMILVALALLNL